MTESRLTEMLFITAFSSFSNEKWHFNFYILFNHFFAIGMPTGMSRIEVENPRFQC